MARAVPALIAALVLALRVPAAAATDLPEAVQHRAISEVTAYNWAAAGTLGPMLAGTALAASGGSDATTRAGVGLILAGIGLGPSLGQFYAGSYAHGLAATALRAGGAALIVYGAAQAVFGNWGCVKDDGSCEEGEGSLTMTGGTLIYLGGVAYSLVDTHFAVHRTAGSRSALSLAPALGKTREGGLRPGLVARVRF